ncbi:LysR family transcriptional regulator [Amycolatopsis sp. YIM 10]|uniref:LysR family transcriptional regulator n=1 Tax=Amycolatopsis sp. YIM 10 TaxID=2653857 RepID=UPI001290073E|nr:LysR family transcriptional regulator [Amycolatopsis sp. YIM 10]QFU90903.1 HTH-type transcriptional regulator GltC [Amycolatopsis sp. YIM 10]
MRMDLTVPQLRAVVEVADAGGFTSAAQRLHLAQSSLSRAIGEVERRVGVALFERTTRKLELTPEGAEFVRIARGVLGSFDAGMRHFAGFLAGTSGHVRVATLPSLAAILLPPVVAAYSRAHPAVELSIEDALSGEVLDRVRAGEVDLAVTVVTEPLPDLDVRELAADRFCGIFPPGHPPVRDWASLAGEPFIAFGTSSSIRRLVDRALDAASVRTGRRTEARNIAAVAGLVAAGLGVSVVPGLVLPLVSFAGLEHAPLAGPAVDRTIAVVRDPARPLAPAVRAFVEALFTDRTELPPESLWLPR